MAGLSGLREPARDQEPRDERDQEPRDRSAANVGAPGGAETAGSTATTEEISLAVAAKASAENFPVALRVLPGRYRRHLSALYGFARLTDDIGDEPLPVPATSQAEETAIRLRLLDDLEADVRKIYQGTPELAINREFARTVHATGIPQRYLTDLIQANRQDQQVARYRGYQDLVRYCELSANPVGRIVLHIFGVATTERAELSDNICTALQLVEHWQDVAEDLGNGRIYLPLEDMERYGCTEADLGEPTAGANVRSLITFEVERAARLLDEGARLTGTLRGAARLAIAGYVAGGRAALQAIADCDFDVLRQTPRPSKTTTLAGMVRCYVRGR